MPTLQHPVAIIGAGPVGLAAAAHLATRDIPFVVYESGDQIGHTVRQWGHVKLFSPWEFNIDSAARILLKETDWTAPDPARYPTGNEIVDDYLAPLAAHSAIESHIRFNHQVTAVARERADLMRTAGRTRQPFVLRVSTPEGPVEHHASAIIDASGTWTTPNSIGANGLPAMGEDALGDRITTGIPDVLGAVRERFVGKRVLVVGSGHSAFNVLQDLATLRDQHPETTIEWAIRRPTSRHIFGGGTVDALPERGALGQRIAELLRENAIRLHVRAHINRLSRGSDGIVAHSGGEALPPVDEIIVVTGFRPDLSILRELRLNLDPAVEAPAALAPLIDPNVHSCGSVPPHGYEELKHPDPDSYVVGMKSYGRAPTFLMMTGYEQVRSITAAIAGDMEAARQVELVLPETGVCSTNRSGNADSENGLGQSSSCCKVTTDVTIAEDEAACCIPMANTDECCSSSAEPELITIGDRQRPAVTGSSGRR
jgi:thioredoxin reductase